jgi:RNA polymerase sigma-70 factor (ECF subfamily)
MWTRSSGRHLTGRDEEAGDLVQETFARALGSGSQFKAGSNLRAWLFRILRNAHIDVYRRARISPIGPSRLEDDSPNASDARATDTEPLRGDAELDQLRGLVAGDIRCVASSRSTHAP